MKSRDIELWFCVIVIFIFLFVAGIKFAIMDTKLDNIESNCTCAQVVEEVE